LLGSHLCLFCYRHMVYCRDIRVLSSSLLFVFFMYSWFSSVTKRTWYMQRFISDLKQDVFGTWNWKAPGAFVWWAFVCSCLPGTLTQVPRHGKTSGCKHSSMSETGKLRLYIGEKAEELYKVIKKFLLENVYTQKPRNYHFS
jgi:hypothetical protein